MPELATNGTAADLPAAAAAAVERVRRDPGAPLVVAVVGPGGTGKTTVLDAVAAAYATAGVTVRRCAGGRPLPAAPGNGPADAPLLVDDAHLLAAGDLARLSAVAATGRLVLAHRPWPRPAGLAALVAGLGGRRSVVVTHHLGRGAVAGRMARRLGVAPPEDMVALVHEQSGGLPALVDVVTRALHDTGRFTAERPDRFRRPDRVSVSVALAERLRHQVDALDPAVAALLEAMAVGAPLDAAVLGPLLDRSPAELSGTVEAARATGLLTEAGELIPFVRSLFLRLLPVLRGRDLQQRLAGLELDRGGSVLAAGRQLLGTGASGARIAAVLRAAADEALRPGPDLDAALAADLLDAAVRAGAPAAGLAGPRARAAALTGDLDLALRLADEVLARPGPDGGGPDADRVDAALAAAVALGARGLGRRGADLVRTLGPRTGLFAVPALVAAGDVAAAEAALGAARTAPAPAGSLHDGAAELAAEAVLGTVRGSGTVALSRLTRAAGLLEPVAATALLPDGPAALAAVVALQCGELAAAEGVLRRALGAGDGGRPGRTRHRLLLAAVELGRGRADRVRRLLDPLAGERLEPRDELLAAGLEIGLARRRADLTALVPAWARAREALVRHPVDLWTLLPLGEVLVGAALLGEADRLAGPLAEAEDLLDRLGRPALWAAPLEWFRLQAALVRQDPDEVPARTAALAGLAATGACPHTRLLADAARAWCAAAGAEPVDPPAVVAVARRMAAAGLGWEAAQLAAWSAAVVPERRGAADLLALARALQGQPDAPEPTPAGSAAPAHATTPDGPVAAFSERELEIGRHILDGLTYKQIGQRLYVSAKTVEHHVARMRQRLGVASRDELFGLLRTALEAGARR